MPARFSLGGGNSVASGNLTLDTPNNSQDKDLLVAIIAYRSNVAFTVPAGWTKNIEQNGGNAVSETIGSISSLLIASKLLVPGDFPLSDPFTFTRAGGDAAVGVMFSFRGVGQSSPVDVVTSLALAAAGTTVGPALSFTTTEADERLLGVVAGARNALINNFTATTPATLAEVTDWFGTASGAHVDIGYGVGTKTIAGATGNFNASDAASARHVIGVIAIKAALSVLITPSVDSMGFATVAPTTLLGSINLTPTPRGMGLATIVPTLILSSIVATPQPASLGFATVDPVVATSSATIVNPIASFGFATVPPTVDDAVRITPTACAMSMISIGPTVAIVQGAAFNPEAPASSSWTAQAAASASWTPQSAPASNPWTPEGSL